MIRRRPTAISLTGGLGNQLFQLAAGLFVTSDSDLEVTNFFGRPRSYSAGSPDLLDFQGLPIRSTHINSREANFLARKSVGYLLRSGIAPKKWELFHLSKLLARFVTSILTSISMREWHRVFSSTEIGFEPLLSISNKGNLLIGYFQSYRYAADPKVLKILQSLSVKGDSTWVQNMRAIALIEKPIVLHVRLTDYVDQTFGLLNSAYYEDAFAILTDHGVEGRVWLFSDDLEGALKIVPKDLLLDARIIREPANTCPAETLEVMRLGHNYIISNSTFSWWGAFLSNTQPIVTYPNPWFADGSKIRDLCPPHWIPISRV